MQGQVKLRGDLSQNHMLGLRLIRRQALKSIEGERVSVIEDKGGGVDAILVERRQGHRRGN
jgi:hypothetical protein